MWTAAGVVLTGGRSSRMGRPKAALEWHGSTLLYRITALMARTVDGPVVVVGAPGQELPELPPGVEVVTDPVQGLGPLQGIGVGLAAVADRAPVAFVCSTDMPLLHPAFVERVLHALDAPDVVVALPHTGGHRQPLAAAYRTALAPLVAELVGDGLLRPGMLFERCAVAGLGDAELLADPVLARLDPGLDSVVNINTPDEYAAARARPPAEVVVVEGGARRTVRAATLGALSPDAPRHGTRHVLNGVELSGAGLSGIPDPRFPLVAGDVVELGR